MEKGTGCIGKTVWISTVNRLVVNVLKNFLCVVVLFLVVALVNKGRDDEVRFLMKEHPLFEIRA